MSDIWSGWDQTDAYDPDMTVAEALEAGLVAVIDSGTIGRTYMGMCGVESNDWDRKRSSQAPMYCTRQIGHDGVHAYVARWTTDPRVEAERLKAVQKTDALYGDDPTRSRHLADALEKVLKRVEELERAERILTEAKRVRDQQAALENARRQAEQTAASLRKMTKAAAKSGAVMDSIHDAMKDIERAIDREESLKPLRRKENQSWANMQAKSKRKTINPKGQRR